MSKKMEGEKTIGKSKNYDWYFNQEAYHPFTYMPTKRIDGS